MKTTPVSPRHPFGARFVRALSRTTSIAPASAAALVLGLLSAFHFDAVRFRPNAAKDYTLEVLEGSDITEGIVVDSAGPITSLGGALSGNNPHDDIDIDLAGLADRTLEDGGVAIIRLAFSGGTGSGAGHHLFLDNVAVTAEVVSDNKFVIAAVPPGATAGSHFSVTVQAQDDMGAPFNATQDTEISLGGSGTGTISGNTATILSGQSSVTLNTVQYTKAEAITLLASRTSGDITASSTASSSITVKPGAASQLAVETAADGSGIPVADRTVFATSPITVYSVSRDSLDNFVANETAIWSLENITGDIVSGDLVDNTNGSATFTANDLGTANSRATFPGLPDADSGLITVEEFSQRYTGAGSVSGWNISGNWTSGILPAFDITQTGGSHGLTKAGPGTLILSGANTYTGTFDNGTVPEGQQGPNDDLDNDGISNLVEYALDGFDPTAPNAPPGSISGLLVSYTKRALAGTNGDVAYIIEESTDLGISDPWATATPTTDNASIISYTLTPPARSKDFVRLKVTQS